MKRCRRHQAEEGHQLARRIESRGPSPIVGRHAGRIDHWKDRTDSSLLGDGVRVLTRTMRKIAPS